MGFFSSFFKVAASLAFFPLAPFLFGGGGGPSFPTPPALPPAPPPPPTPADPEVARARARQRERAALAGRRQGTIQTSGLGLLTPASTAKKTLVGT